jgi:predicted nucleotidyltransferase
MNKSLVDELFEDSELDQKIVKSFYSKESLSPDIFEEDNGSFSMKDNIRTKLLEIADKFVEFIGIDFFIDDVHLTGSLSNFNWSEYSDFDLHVIVDFEKYENQEDLYKELFDLKKKLFNDKHNIKIFGYDVEVYAQGITDESHSDGVYSVMNNEWVHKPKRTSKNLDMSVLKTKIKSWTDKIDDAIEDAKSEGNVEVLKKLNAIYSANSCLSVIFSLSLHSISLIFSD